MASILHCRRNQRASASSSHRPRYTATVARLHRRARASPSSSCSQSHLHLGSSSSSSRISHRSRKNQSSSLSNTPSSLLSRRLQDGPMMKTTKGSVTGFAAGTIYGTILATWKNVPRVERNVALPGLIRTLKMMGTHGLTFAAIGGVYIGVEQVVQSYRGKRDFFNGAIGGFTTRVDNGREYYPYTPIEKTAQADA
ncbi:unnamed protein product [Brassica oleracea]